MKPRDEILDLIRGLSALVVLLAHVRGFVLLDLGQLESPGLVTKGFYFATGIHHQAVMIFFVLSGYFVGGSVIDALGRGKFSAPRYALARLSRLWVVLVPALLLTFLLDAAGKSIDPSAYSGALREQFMSGPELGSEASASIGSFLGNLAFLQTIELPVFGSNGPLWSLANEFWYYVLFPLLAATLAPAWLPVTRHAMMLRLGSAAALGLLIWWLPAALLWKGLIWLLGVGVWWLVKNERVMAVADSLPWRVASGGAFLACLMVSKTDLPIGSDYAVGLSFALWMPSLIGPWRKRGCWVPLGNGMSAISYTLYVVHFPLLFFVAATQLKGKQFAPDGLGLAWFGGLGALCLLVSMLMWWLFERRTDAVRRWIGRVLQMNSLKSAPVLPSPP